MAEDTLIPYNEIAHIDSAVAVMRERIKKIYGGSFELNANYKETVQRIIKNYVQSDKWKTCRDDRIRHSLGNGGWPVPEALAALDGIAGATISDFLHTIFLRNTLDKLTMQPNINLPAPYNNMGAANNLVDVLTNNITVRALARLKAQELGQGSDGSVLRLSDRSALSLVKALIGNTLTLYGEQWAKEGTPVINPQLPGTAGDDAEARMQIKTILDYWRFPMESLALRHQAAKTGKKLHR